ncbi:hypothetical protein B9Z19DRAFT_1101607 [Tuber borchii]|uniref:Uncharacterized protein n=1 Tax=Tuber borchii TaxID=42251 RepID=A0A2T6ZRC3_TUBBO|nr:hypothetical protein B9Z19DRAFT_1101607 [Tuber borchii]
MGITGSEVGEGGDIAVVFSVMGVEAIVGVYEAPGAGGTMRLMREGVPEEPAGGLSMAQLSSTRRRVSSVRRPECDPAMNGSLVELASSSSCSRSHERILCLRDCVEDSRTPFYPGGSIIEFVS